MCQYLLTGNFVEIELTGKIGDKYKYCILDTKNDYKHWSFVEGVLDYQQDIRKKTNFFLVVRRKNQSI